MKRADLLLFSLLSFLELAASSVYLVLTAHQYKGIFLFGLMQRGIIEPILFILLSLAFLLVFILVLKNWSVFQGYTLTFINSQKIWLAVLLGVGLIIGWATLTIPPEFFGRFGSYYQWLRPASLAIGLIGLQGWSLYLFRSGQTAELKEAYLVIKSRFFIILTAVVLFLFTVSYLTKFGILADTPLWNVPGVPVSGVQMFLAVIAIVGLMVLEAAFPRFKEFLARKGVQAMIIGLVFLAAILVWGLTPLKGDSLAVTPSVSNPQPYPQHDARVHDLGALSILFGEGINSRQYTDKPLYMVTLALFHLITGYDYRLLQWVQVIFLALIPVLAYLFGKKFHSPLFGILLVVLVILQQRNAVVLSRMISSVNVKILATEVFVLLGIIALTLLLFNWNKKNDKGMLLLAGGVVGALSLIRLNPLLFIPFIALAIILRYWKSKRQVFSRLLLFLLGFVIVFTPWVISGTDAQGQPFLYVKIRDVFENRIAPQVGNSGVEGVLSTPAAGNLSLKTEISDLHLNQTGFIHFNGLSVKVGSIKAATGAPQYLQLVADHFLHNIVTSIIPLPDVLSRKGILVLAQRDYWNDLRTWDGNLSSGLIRFMLINLLLFSLGVTCSWRRWRWKGLIPLGVFLVYDLAVSISLTSGGRYIVPIIWIIFFYYSFGIVFLVNMLIRLFIPGLTVSDQLENEQSLVGRQPRMLTTVIALVIVALLIPVANQLVPLLVKQSPVEKAEELFASLGPVREPGMNYLSGIMLYPVYEPGQGKVMFDFDRVNHMDEVSFELFPPQGSVLVMNTRLQSGDPVMLEYNLDDQLSGVFIFRESKLLEYWSLGENAILP